jgi:hypothetical protein
MISDAVSPAFIVVSADDIAERAYGFYLDRGCADGFDCEDWLRAERELKAPRAVAATSVSGRSSKKR